MSESTSTEQLVAQRSAYHHIGPSETHGFEKSKHFIGKGYKEFLHNWHIPQGAKVLDVATGRGEAAEFLRELFGAHVVQTDLSTFPLRLQQTWLTRLIGRTKPLAAAKATEQPFPDNTFNAIHMKDVLVHIEDKKKLLAEMSRLLKPGGKLLIVTQEQDKSCIFLQTPELHNKKPSPITVVIKDSEQYAKLIKKIEQDNMTFHDNPIVSISPPYFRIDFEALTEEAQRNKLVPAPHSFVQKNGWKPSKKDPDWHHGFRKVREFVKI